MVYVWLDGGLWCRCGEMEVYGTGVMRWVYGAGVVIWVYSAGMVRWVCGEMDMQYRCGVMEVHMYVCGVGIVTGVLCRYSDRCLV